MSRITKNLSSTFTERVIKIALSIPPGKVTTYGRIARAAGSGGMAAQSITAILGKAYNSGIKNIPFHRIVYAGGKIWVDAKHRTERMKLYKKEGIIVNATDRIVNFENVLL